MPQILRNLTGQRFGRLLVLERYGSTIPVKWKCLCDCGNETVVQRASLCGGHIKSCGCWRKDRMATLNRSHGLTKTLTYQMWHAAKHRAEKYGIRFDLSMDDIPEIPKVCPILGIVLTAKIAGARNARPSLDRIIPMLGYIKHNIAVISNKANTMKKDGNVDDHIRISEDMKRKGDMRKSQEHMKIAEYITKHITPALLSKALAYHEISEGVRQINARKRSFEVEE